MCVKEEYLLSGSVLVAIAMLTACSGGFRGQTDRGYKKPVTNTDNEIAIPLGIKRIPDN